MKDLLVETCKFVAVSEVVPKNWRGWFYEHLSEVSDLCWGSNNRSMVDAPRFRHCCEEIIEWENENQTITDFDKDAEALRDTLSYLEANSIYIDLEN